jgi:CheY-like chemotaxis protein
MTSLSAASRKMLILIADDYTPFRSLIRQKLYANGFRSIVEAVDGLDAVAKATELQPDLVLLDIGMPGLDGIV